LTFFLGALSAGAALFGGEILATGFAQFFDRASIIYACLNYFIAVALVEELVKYLAVRLVVADFDEFDEPIDSMVYMVSSAMGFATAENILTNVIKESNMIGIGSRFAGEHVIINTIYRFFFPTLLHAVCSAIVGYFLAMAFFRSKKFATIIGLTLAIFIHGAYDLLSYVFGGTGEAKYFLYMMLLLFVALFFVSRVLFKQLRRQQIAKHKIIWHFSPDKK
jgi:RsiW-degrading membrane proteinase PrsW (M82 family)